MLGSDASENNFKKLPLGDYQIIHMACHGFLDNNNPMRSALLLSSDSGEDDGFLQMREIYRLRLNAELVVLSSCQTGKGVLEQGEGVVGLPRSFLLAGAKSVLSTLWTIDDRATALFMDSFYQSLSEGNSKVAALRNAKIKMMRSRYGHPFYWSPFILSGEGESSIRFH
jgi:CHAT domain-containing protein